MPRVALLVTLAVSALLPAAGHAGTPAAAKKKVAVLDVRAVGEVDPRQIAGLSSLIAAEFARSKDLQVTAGSDLRTMIGFERERQLLGCNDSSCLAELAGGLGVDYLVSTEVSRLGRLWLYSQTLLDTVRGKAKSRVGQRCDTAEQLADLAVAGVREQLAELLGTPAPTPSPAPAAAVAPAAAPTPASAEVSAGMSPRRTAGFVVGALGLALLASSAVTWSFATHEQDLQRVAGTAGDETSWRQHGEASRLDAALTYALGGVGVAALGTGVVLVIIGGPSSPAAGAASSGPAGAALVVTGGF